MVVVRLIVFMMRLKMTVMIKMILGIVLTLISV